VRETTKEGGKKEGQVRKWGRGRGRERGGRGRDNRRKVASWA